MGKKKRKRKGGRKIRPREPKKMGLIWKIGLVLGLVGLVMAALPLKKMRSGRNTVAAYTYRVIRRLPHDPQAYTQGLVFRDGVFYESTGLKGQSSLRKVDPETGEILKRVDLAERYFGEGLTYFQGVLIQLTWQSGRAFFYDSENFELLREYSYGNEGWGLASDGAHLIMSDGSDTLSFRVPDSFEVVRKLKVTGPGVGELNELEYIEGEIWANVYLTFQVLRISPETGKVLGLIDFRGILAPGDRNGQEDVFNGIAYDAEQKRIFVTGKRYTYVYQVEIEPKR